VWVRPWAGFRARVSFGAFQVISRLSGLAPRRLNERGNWPAARLPACLGAAALGDQGELSAYRLDRAVIGRWRLPAFEGG
jgi:hypothetical protein